MRRTHALLCLFFLTACSQQVSKSQEPIKIGGLFALTGFGASQGTEEMQAATLAVEEINAAGGIHGRPLKMVVEDVSIDKLKDAVSAVQKIINVDNVLGIVGPTWDEPAQVILPIIEKHNIPTIGPNQTNALEKKKPYDYFFSTWYSNAVGVQRLLLFAQSNGWNRVAIIRPIGAGFYQYIADRFHEYADEYGVTIIEDINLNQIFTKDFRTPLTKIKDLNVDAIHVILGLETECTFLKQAKELGLDLPVLATEAAGDMGALEQCADLLEQLYVAYPREFKEWSSFAARYEERFGNPPKAPSAPSAYDAVRILAEGLKQTNGEGGKALRDAIASIHDYQGVSLPSISFDTLGFMITPDDAFEIRTVRDGQFVTYEK